MFYIFASNIKKHTLKKKDEKRNYRNETQTDSHELLAVCRMGGGAYLTSMGTYLFNIGLGAKIGLFYAMQGIVSLFMPAIMGIIADRWVPAQKLYGFCHFMAAVFMVAAGWYGYVDGEAVNFGTLFTFYSLSVAFYMPTLALTNSVAYTALDKVKLDPVIAFPPIRIFGTIGFICSMLLTDILGFQNNYMQFFFFLVLALE